MKRILFFVELLALASQCYGAGERELVAVLAARVRWGLTQRAQMPDMPPNVQLNLHASAVGFERAETESQSTDAASQHVERESVEETHSAVLSLFAPVGIDAVQQPYQVTVYMASWCGPCQSVKLRDGDGNRFVHLDWVEGRPPGGITEAYPTYCWHDATERLRYIVGAHTLEQLVKYIERNEPPKRKSANAAATAVGGTLQTGGRIKTAITAWRNHLGPDAVVSLKWERSQDLKLSVKDATKLLHGELWTPTQVAGTFGRVAFTTTSTCLPDSIQSLCWSYSFDDDQHLTVDPGPIRLTIREVNTSAVPSSSTYGFIDPLSLSIELSSVCEFFTVLHQLLNPQIDVTLPGSMTVTASLGAGKIDGAEKLVVTFTDCPSIHVQAWFQFELEVSSVEITQTNVHVAFKPQPQNWIRIESRDFQVND